jgi:hypothetical protein
VWAGLLVLLLLVLPLVSLNAQESARRYVETHGKRTSVVEYRVSRAGDEISVDVTGGVTSSTIRWRSGLGTYDWQMTDAAAGTSLHGRRTGDVIHVTGTLKNRTVERDVRVDAAPWYQVFGPLLEELLPEGAAQQEFWVVDPGDFAPHKMQVKRAGSEKVTIKGIAVDAARIHFSPAGALAPFWGADFWYRQGDGMYVSSRLPEGGGTTVTTIEDPTQ